MPALPRAFAALLIALHVLPALAADAKEPGGKGSLRPMGLQQVCFKSASKTVPEVCATYQINWKLWTLMGEPIGNYVLSWNALSVRIADAAKSGNQEYKVKELPPALADATQKLELYIEAVAFVNSPGATKRSTVALAFDTGVATRPGQTSMNVPSGYNWDKFLYNGMSSKGMNLDGWCIADGRTQLPAIDAKALMRAGIRLENIQLCPKSSVDTDALERAIAKYCEAEPTPKQRYCAVKPATPAPSAKPAQPPANTLDAAFSKLDNLQPTKQADEGKKASSIAAAFDVAESDFKKAEEARRKADEARRQREADAEVRAARERVATSECKRELVDVQSCMKQSCGSEPEARVCTEWRDPEPPDCKPNTRCLFLNLPVCVHREPNPALPKWQQCRQQAEKSCAAGKPSSIEQCVADRLKRS